MLGIIIIIINGHEWFSHLAFERNGNLVSPSIFSDGDSLADGVSASTARY